VYQLPTETVRVDTTTVAMYHDPEASTLIAHGYSKDHRPDLAQVKVLLATLDPLALPVVTLVVSGQQADEGLYVPAIQQAQCTFSAKGLLYVGDSKMEALATRAHLVQRGDYYLMPLSQKSSQRELLAEKVAYVLTEKPARITVYPAEAEGESDTVLAQGWESTRPQVATLAETEVQWAERLLLIYSPTLARSAERGLERRLRTAEAKLTRLTPAVGRGKRQYRTLAPLQAAVENILQQHRVAEFLQVDYHQHVTKRHIRKYRDKPARTETRVRYAVGVTRNAVAIQSAQRRMGWRLYATNAPTARLTLADAVRTYRGTVPTIERLFARLKGRPLGLRPVFVHRDDHIKGLLRLLSLALRILTLIEFVAQRGLRTEHTSLAGLYPGNPTRATDHPTTDRLLRVFKGITLSLIELPDQHIRHISPLSKLQNRILSLLRCSTNIYADLVQVPSIPP
jgi:transposase